MPARVEKQSSAACRLPESPGLQRGVVVKKNGQINWP